MWWVYLGKACLKLVPLLERNSDLFWEGKSRLAHRQLWNKDCKKINVYEVMVWQLTRTHLFFLTIPMSCFIIFGKTIPSFIWVDKFYVVLEVMPAEIQVSIMIEFDYFWKSPPARKISWANMAVQLFIWTWVVNFPHNQLPSSSPPDVIIIMIVEFSLNQINLAAGAVGGPELRQQPNVASN